MGDTFTRRSVMRKKPMRLITHIKGHLNGGLTFLALATSLCFASLYLVGPATAQTAPAQGAQDTKPLPDRSGDKDRDTNYGELMSFDKFLDGHREIAEQIRKDPSLVNNEDYVKAHPALQTYLQNHPDVRGEIRENPNAFMHAENRVDRPDVKRPPDINYGELTSFDKFLDGHREISEQIHKDPSLLDNREFVMNHPALQTYLQDHPEVRNTIRENPNAFMHAENRYDRTEDGRDRDFTRDRDTRDHDTTHRELASFDRFLDSHHETAEQLRKNPSLVDNQEFVKNHPALQTYLQDHPGVREEIKENPNAFMQQEARYDQHEARFDHDNRTGDMDRDGMHRHFGEFLGGHSDIAQQLSKDPSQVKNQEFLESHPDLKAYLNAHPDVRQQLMANPDTFIKSSQQFTNNSSQTVKTTNPTAKPKTNQ
jgi:hypothetical protein